MSKETDWLKKRIGMITASELGDITSASGKIIDGNLDYIRSKRWERKHGFSHHISSITMDIGKEQEKYAVEWLRANVFADSELVYAQELPSIPFWISPDCPLGASPDTYTADEKLVVEIKTLVGRKTTEFFGDDKTSYEEKFQSVLKEHGDQVFGQFLSNPNVEDIWVLKYIHQDDEIMEDTDSPLAPWRGIIFKFSRSAYEQSIAELKERICLFNAMIDSDINPSDFKKGEWYLDNGILKKRDEASKKSSK